MGKTRIEWCDATWSPVTGCSPVGPGCDHCYARRQAMRRMAPEWKGDRQWEDVRCHPERLDQPSHWRKPRRVFVCSMGDLFHAAVPGDFIFQVLNAALQGNRRHTYIVLTKRADRMKAWFAEYAPRFWHYHAPDEPQREYVGAPWPDPQLWLGVSVWDQESADAMIPVLLDTPAARRLVSIEPMIASVDLNGVGTHFLGPASQARGMNDGLDQVIVGGETGPGARPCDVEWIRSIVGQCREAGVPCYVKQLGSRPVGLRPECDRCNWQILGTKHSPDCSHAPVLHNRRGADPSEWPIDLRVREWGEEASNGSA